MKCIATLSQRSLLLTVYLMGSSAYADFKALDWVALLPAADYQALLSAPPIQHTGGDGAGAPAPLLNSAAALDTTLDEAMYSTNVRTEFNGQDISLPGFVVPLEYDENQNVTEFFLVPYFGACIHTPPPPANQIVLVSPHSQLKLSKPLESMDVVWVEGELKEARTQTQSGVSGYSLEAIQIYPYKALHQNKK
mgnify:CR=1 FL=1